MTTATAGYHSDDHSSRDFFAKSRKEGWATFVYAKPRTRPESLTRRQLRALSDTAAADYNQRRSLWHANLGPFNTPQLAALHDDLWDIVDSNRQDADKAKGAVAVDGHPGLGKSTAVDQFAKEFHRREIAAHGVLTRNRSERWPVCHIGLTGNPSIKDFNRTMLGFFAHPGVTRGTSTQFAERAMDCMISCETRLLVIDDLHFLRPRSTTGIEISNQFKYIANEFPVTMIFIGVGLTKGGLFNQGGYEQKVLDQTGRRTTVLTMSDFSIADEVGRRDWRDLLSTIERYVVLANMEPGILADALPEFLYARSGGHIGSLMNLINRGCHRAIRRGTETLTEQLLKSIPIDVAAAAKRQELEFSFEANRRTARPKRRTAPPCHP